MGRLFYIMGKSASGKDKIYKGLLEKNGEGLLPLVLYTTRPKRHNETDGMQYHFVDEDRLQKLRSAGKIIEERSYDTACGVWAYFTVDDGTIDLDRNNYLGIGTLESFKKLKAYFGEDHISPIYIEVDDGIRLERALTRERKQEEPKYREMCRRYLADCEDFSKEKIRQARITRCFTNEGELADCMKEVEEFIHSMIY